jgi:cytochrome P450
VFVCGADLNREVVTLTETYHKSAIGGLQKQLSTRQQIMWNWGTGLFHVNGEMHRQHRRLLMPAFHKKQIESYRDDMVLLTQRMLDRWQVGQRVDVQDEMSRLSLRIAGKSLFGDADSHVGVLLQQMIRVLLRPTPAILGQDIPGFPLHHALNASQQADQKLRQQMAYKREHGLDNNDVLSMLLQAQDEDGARLTDDEVVGHVGIIFMAGHETSANALTWTLLLLSQHTSVAADLLDELSNELHGEPPTIEQIAKLGLLDRVVKESLRLLPPVPLNHRILAEPTELGGHLIPTGTEVFVSIYHLHHDPALFPQPEKFDPDRWLTINPTAFEYNPFSAGPRMCIGAPFALLEIKVVLATLLQRHRLEFIPGTRLDRRVRITMAPLHGLPMMVRPQDRQFTRGGGGIRGNVREMVAWPQA